MALSAAVGVVVGLPALRVKGIYLGIATLAFGFIVEEVLARWESVTGGNAGLAVKGVSAFGWSLASAEAFYWLCLALAVLATLAVLNLLRSPTGRAFVAIRDSEISAQSMGIHLARYKSLSFAISAALAGLGGALYAHKISFLSPDQFNIVQSIDLLLLVVIGGLGSVHGAFLGAIFLIAMPQLISLGKDFLPAAIGQAAGPAGGGVRRGADRLRAVRADGPVRPLAQGAHLAATGSRSTARACSSGRNRSRNRTGEMTTPKLAASPLRCPPEGRSAGLGRPGGQSEMSTPLLSRQPPERPLRRRARRQRRELRRAAGARCSR